MGSTACRAFAVHIRDEIRRWTGVVQKADIRLDSK
jgi:hypothetical protein